MRQKRQGSQGLMNKETKFQETKPHNSGTVSWRSILPSLQKESANDQNGDGSQGL